MTMNPFAPKEFPELPTAIWMPRNGTRVFRGSAVDILLEMAASKAGRKTRSVKQALKLLVEDLSKSNRVRVNIPWEQPEGPLAKAFLKAMLQAGICQPVPRA